MKIKSATVLIGLGRDRVSLKTDLPSPYTLEYDPEETPLELSFQATKGNGANYCRQYFNIEPEIIDCGSQIKKASSNV